MVVRSGDRPLRLARDGVDAGAPAAGRWDAAFGLRDEINALFPARSKAHDGIWEGEEKILIQGPAVFVGLTYDRDQGLTSADLGRILRAIAQDSRYLGYYRGNAREAFRIVLAADQLANERTSGLSRPERVASGETGAPRQLLRPVRDADVRDNAEAGNPYAWTLYDPAWMPPGVPFDRRNPRHAAAVAAWAGYAGMRAPDLFSDGDLGWYYDPRIPQHGAYYTGESAAVPEITPLFAPDRGRVHGYPVDSLDWSKGIAHSGSDAGDPQAERAGGRHQPGSASGTVAADTPLFSDSGNWADFLGVVPAGTRVQILAEGGVTGSRPRSRVKFRGQTSGWATGWVWSDMVVDSPDGEAGAPASSHWSLRGPGEAGAPQEADAMAALHTLLKQIDQRWPNRTRGRSDGIQVERGLYVLAISEDAGDHLPPKLPSLAALSSALAVDPRFDKAERQEPSFWNTIDVPYLRCRNFDVDLRH